MSRTGLIKISHRRGLLRAGVSLQTLGIAIAAGLAGASPAEAGCTSTGSVLSFQCDAGGVNIQPYGTDVTTVVGMTIPSGWINYSVRPAGTQVVTQPLAITLNVSNTSVTASGNGAVNVSAHDYAADITVNLDPDVVLENTGGSGGLWVRDEKGGNIVVTSGATITSTGSPALTATSNAGSVSITNTGTVTSTDNWGIYADGSPVAGSAVPVTVNNSGLVNAYLAGIRAIDYLGVAKIENSGTVTSTTKQGLIAWSQSGDANIDNSGSVLARNYIGVQASADAGNVTVTNSGYIEAQRDTSLGASTTNQGISASASNNVTITNTATGRVIAGSDSGIYAQADNGTISVSNSGGVTGTHGVVANATIGTVSLSNTGTITATAGNGTALTSGNGAVSLTNNGTITGPGLGVSLNGTTNLLQNNGTIRSSGSTAVQTGNGNSTVVANGVIAAHTASDTAISMGSGSNRLVLSDTASLTGKVVNASTGNMLELTGSASGTLALGAAGTASNFQGFANLTKSGTGHWTVTGDGATGFGGAGAIDAGTLTLTGSLGLSTMTIGNTGQATLNVNGGGALTSSHATIGTNAGGNGLVTVSGSGSKWTSTGNIYVGNGGNGTLNVQNGAVVAAVDGYVSTLTGSTSTLLVSGASAAMNLSGVFIAGYSAGTNATVTLSNGGQISGLQGTLGDLAGSSGSMSISGSGSKWSAFVDNSITYSGYLNVGRLGAGSLTISNGGTVSGERLYIGNDVGSQGTVTLSGNGSLIQMNSNLYVGSEGTGTLTLSDGAQISAAAIKVGYLSGATGTLNVGAASGQTAAAAGTINTAEIVLGAGASKLVLNHTESNFGLSANITGAGQLSQLSGTSILTGTNTYTGGTTISGGTLSIGNGGTAGSVAGNITDNASLVFNRSDDVQYASIVSGTGSVTKTGAGTLTLTGSNSYTGGTTVAAGTLQLGNGANTGSLAGAIANSGTVVFNRTDDVVAGGAITGSGGLIKRGAGKLTLTGTNSAAAGTTVEQGQLQISDGTSLTSNVTVGSGASLLATNGGAINGMVSVQDSGTLVLAPSTVSGYGLSMTGLTLSHNATLSVILGAPTGTALASVGTLSLDGMLNVINAGAMTQGVYRLLDYTTLASNAGLRLGTTPTDFSYEIQQISGQVNLSVLTSTMSYWNGSQTTADGTVHGGNGTWTNNAGLTNWTTPLANQSRGWSNTFAVFGGTAGTVTIDNTFGAVSASGLQFMVDGYTLTGGQLTLAASSGQTPIRVGDGTSSGASFVATINSDITGTTGLEKTDLGTLILTGMNNYTGGTTITQGTLQIGNGGTSGSILGDVVNNGILAFNRSDAGTYAGSLSGTGVFSKLGSGTLTLAGTNTYTGNTNINAGTLIVSGGQAIGDTSAVSVANGAHLTVQSNETIGSIAGGGGITLAGANLTAGGNNTSTLYSGVIDGSGGLIKTGSGVLVLTGASSYTGGTTIAAGTLQIGNGGTTGSITGNVVNNANLVFNRSDNYVFNGSVTGAGSVTFKGGGKVEFSSPYNGPVSVEDSFTQLQQGTVTASQFTVNAGGVLGGTASIGGLTINSGGTAAPGYSPGTLTVNGPVTFNSGSIYAVDVTPEGAHDLIIANGAVTLSSGANVQVSAVAGRYPSTSKMAIITTSGTVTGTFGGVTSNYAFLSPQLSYDAQNVYLTLNYNGVNFRDYARTPNQTNVADAAQSLGTGKLVFDALYALPQTAVAPALDQLSGEIYASTNTVIHQQSIYLRDAVGARLRQSEAASGDPSSALNAAAKAGGPVSTDVGKDLLPTVWMQGYGGWGERFGNTNAATTSNTIGGVFGGVDVELSDTLRVGLIGGFSQSHFDVDGRNSSGSMSNYDLGLYAGKQFGPIALRGGVSHSWHDVTISRNISFSGFSDSEQADRMLGTTQVFGELAYDMDVGGYNLEPFVGLAYVNTKGGSFTERGLNGAALAVNTDTQNTLYSTLGARAATTIALGESVLTPSLTLGWQHANGDTSSEASARFQSGGSMFRVSGVPTTKDTALIGIGVAYDISETSKFQFNYSGQIATHGVQNAFSAQFSVKF